MKNLKKLSREELKSVKGGAPINGCRLKNGTFGCRDSCGVCVDCSLALFNCN